MMRMLSPCSNVDLTIALKGPNSNNKQNKNQTGYNFLLAYRGDPTSSHVDSNRKMVHLGYPLPPTHTQDEVWSYTYISASWSAPDSAFCQSWSSRSIYQHTWCTAHAFDHPFMVHCNFLSWAAFIETAITSPDFGQCCSGASSIDLRARTQSMDSRCVVSSSKLTLDVDLFSCVQVRQFFFCWSHINGAKTPSPCEICCFKNQLDVNFWGHCHGA